MPEGRYTIQDDHYRCRANSCVVAYRKAIIPAKPVPKGLNWGAGIQDNGSEFLVKSHMTFFMQVRAGGIMS